jgi:hypothetical protein
MANPDAPWGFSDLRNSVDSELVASAETATEAYPDGAVNRDDFGSARYYGRYGRSVENKEEPTYYYLGKRSTNAESNDAPQPPHLPLQPHYSKRSTDAVDTAAKDNVSSSYNRYLYGYSYPYASGYGYPYAYGYRYLGKRSADAEPEIVTDSGLSHYNYVRYRPYGSHYRVIGKRSTGAEPQTNPTTVKLPPYIYYDPYDHRHFGFPMRSADTEPEIPLDTSADAVPQTDADAGTPRYYYA